MKRLTVSVQKSGSSPVPAPAFVDSWASERLIEPQNEKKNVCIFAKFWFRKCSASSALNLEVSWPNDKRVERLETSKFRFFGKLCNEFQEPCWQPVTDEIGGKNLTKPVAASITLFECRSGFAF